MERAKKVKLAQVFEKCDKDVFYIRQNVNVVQQNVLISVDGNIGAGKTALLNSLQSKHVIIITEPVDDWKPLLLKVSQNPKKYIYLLQLEILKHYSFVKNFINDQRNCMVPKLIIVEQSVESSVSIFAKSFVEMSHLSKKDFFTLSKLASQAHIDFDFRILVQMDVDICIKRIQTRGRGCEQSLTKAQFYNSFKDVEKYIIDGNQSKQQVLSCFSSFLKKKSILELY